MFLDDHPTSTVSRPCPDRVPTRSESPLRRPCPVPCPPYGGTDTVGRALWDALKPEKHPHRVPDTVSPETEARDPTHPLIARRCRGGRVLRGEHRCRVTHAPKRSKRRRMRFGCRTATSCVTRFKRCSTRKAPKRSSRPSWTPPLCRCWPVSLWQWTTDLHQEAQPVYRLTEEAPDAV